MRLWLRTRWPRWRRGGSYYRGPMPNGGWIWTANEGECPNFCIMLGGAEGFFLYLCLAPNIRFHTNMLKRWWWRGRFFA